MGERGGAKRRNRAGLVRSDRRDRRHNAGHRESGRFRDPAADHRGNRIKRIFSDDYSLRVARWGLGPRAEQLPPRVSYATIRDAGCTLGVPDGERPWGAYVYARDTTDVFNELGAAIYFRGRRHSTLRIVYGAQFI